MSSYTFDDFKKHWRDWPSGADIGPVLEYMSRQYSVRRMLAVDGHQIETANSGEQALALFGIEKLDLVLTDYKMPNTKGDEPAAAIKALAPNQPVPVYRLR